MPTIQYFRSNKHHVPPDTRKRALFICNIITRKMMFSSCVAFSGSIWLLALCHFQQLGELSVKSWKCLLFNSNRVSKKRQAILETQKWQRYRDGKCFLFGLQKSSPDSVQCKFFVEAKLCLGILFWVRNTYHIKEEAKVKGFIHTINMLPLM